MLIALLIFGGITLILWGLSGFVGYLTATYELTKAQREYDQQVAATKQAKQELDEAEQHLKDLLEQEREDENRRDWQSRLQRSRFHDN